MDLNSKVLFTCFLMLLVLYIPSTTAIKEKGLKKICSKTIDKKGCMHLLKSDGHTSFVNLEGLTEVALDVALEKLRTTREKLDVLGDGTSDNNYDEYSPCSRNYKEAINKLELAEEHLKSRDYSNIDENIVDALEKIEKCKKVSLGDSVEVKDIINDVKLACSIVKITSQKLNREKKNTYKKHKHEEDTYDD